MKASKQKKQIEKIYWRSLPKDCRVRFDSSSYYYWDGSLIIWHSSETNEAKSYLNTRVR